MRTATMWLTCLSKSRGNSVGLSFSAVNPPLAATAERGQTGGGSGVYVSVVGGRSGCLNPFMLWGCPHIIATAELLKWGGFEVSLSSLNDSIPPHSNDMYKWHHTACSLIINMHDKVCVIKNVTKDVHYRWGNKMVILEKYLITHGKMERRLCF